MEVLSESYDWGKQKPSSLVPCSKVSNYYLATSSQFFGGRVYFVFEEDSEVCKSKPSLFCLHGTVCTICAFYVIRVR
jgi:hypothetical protein